MRKTCLDILAAVVAFVAVGSLCHAAPFEAEFKASKVVGECSVKAPGATDYAPIQEGKSYAYGSAVKTGAGAEILVSLSEGNTCRVIQNSELLFAEDVADKKVKHVTLEKGTTVVQLDPDFGKSNGFELRVPAAVCTPTGGRFVAVTGSESGVISTAFQVDSGELKIVSNYFNVQSVKAGDKLSVSYPADKVWYRVKNLAGKFTVAWTDSEGASKSVELMDKKSVKIFIVRSPTTQKELRAVYLFDADNRTTLASWVEAGATGPDLPAPGAKPTVQDDKLSATEEALLWTEIPVATTTTTTVPSPTPVGAR